MVAYIFIKVPIIKVSQKRTPASSRTRTKLRAVCLRHTGEFTRRRRISQQNSSSRRVIANFIIYYSEREVRLKKYFKIRYFRRGHESQLWEILAPITCEDITEGWIGDKWGEVGARKANVSSEGVYVVTAQHKNLYEKAGVQLMRRERGSVYVSRLLAFEEVSLGDLQRGHERTRISGIGYREGG